MVEELLGVSMIPLLTRLWSPYLFTYHFFFFFLTLYHVPFVLFLILSCVPCGHSLVTVFMSSHSDDSVIVSAVLWDEAL